MPNMNKTAKIARRIGKETGFPYLAETLAGELSPSDFSSLLTETFALRASRISAHALPGLYAQNAYIKPAGCDAAQYRRLEADMLDAAGERDVEGVIVSPAAVFGCCSAFGAVSQNKIITAGRGLEIVSDATNVRFFIKDFARSCMRRSAAKPRK